MTPPRLRSRASLATAAALAAIAVAFGPGCGSDKPSPVEVRLKEDTKKVTVLGFPALATKNTTRVGGKDAIADAAAVATAVYPGHSATTRPGLVSLVDMDDWRSGIAAAALMAPPLRAPVLFGSPHDVPDVTREVLGTLKPRGSPKAKGIQVLRVGDVAAPGGLRTASLGGPNPYSLAEAIDLFLTEAAGQPSPRVVIASADDKAFAMPAAAWAAKSGDPILFAHENLLPPETVNAIKRHEHPSIYVLGPPTAISDAVLAKLRKLGDVKRISGRTPVENAIAFARFSDGDFGWGLRDPGHGIVFANLSRVQDAGAAAALNSSGKYGPLLLLDSPKGLAAPLENYLLDIQPGYRFDPVRGVYNHAWLMGDESAITVDLQGRIDELMEIVRVKQQQGAR
jgi:putative cell wall binding repeat protein